MHRLFWVFLCITITFLCIPVKTYFFLLYKQFSFNGITWFRASSHAKVIFHLLFNLEEGIWDTKVMLLQDLQLPCSPRSWTRMQIWRKADSNMWMYLVVLKHTTHGNLCGKHMACCVTYPGIKMSAGFDIVWLSQDFFYSFWVAFLQQPSGPSVLPRCFFSLISHRN